MDHDLEVDALGLLCPLPVLRLRKRMQPLPPGAVIRLLADDPAAHVDVPHFCVEQGHEFIGVDGTAFTIRKG
ncbi:sulfurtransferase TusA family protein [Jannaschia aquimarina]|uniref:TusA protein n=1 Tax=Jannaschia aquimarina TaxID=935700 RepID=A0A0D1EID5_9RHOB|nr:sulfurtransferase TusA family protein [Jannaschia aquimarina]KIT17359.1 Sulfurtransferase TusA [Jannaschia aquimarina]SNT20886.1 tRNA 2-thiouridine synthesizing protein A [Jannaschia aquimarina]